MQTQRFRRNTLVAVLLTIGLWMVPGPAPAVEVGQQAPDFVMHSTVGESVRLSDYQGKKNVMLFSSSRPSPASEPRRPWLSNWISPSTKASTPRSWG